MQLTAKEEKKRALMQKKQAGGQAPKPAKKKTKA
jgi:hypothetical protein